jgi:hypothetical protein
MTTQEILADIASMVTRLASNTLNARPVTRGGVHDAEKLVLAAGELLRELLRSLRTGHQAEPKRRRTSSARRRGGAHG